MFVPTTVTLLGRGGCHLCDDARLVVAEVLEDFPAVRFVEFDIDEDPGLRERYAEEIPVVLIDDRVHNIWRIDPVRLRAALGESTAEAAAPDFEL